VGGILMMTTRTRDLLIGLTALAVAALLVASQIVGCAASKTQPTARVRPSPTRALEPGGLTDADCLALLDRRDGAQLAGKILAGVGGVAALGTAPDAVPEGARWGIGAGAATAAAVGVAVIWYGERKSDEFERYCEVADESEEDAGNQPVEGSAVSDLAPSPFGADGWVE
jgi:hypothetical protein